MSNWKDIPLASLRPSQRGGHASAVIPAKDEGGSLLVIIGGSDAFGMAYNDVHVVALPPEVEGSGAAANCTLVQASGGSSRFAPRMGHSAHALSPDVWRRMETTASAFPTAEPVVEVCEETEDAKSEDAAPKAAVPSKMKQLSLPIVVFGGMSVAPEMVHNSVWLLRVDLGFKERLDEDAQRKIRTASSLGPLVTWEELGGCTGDVPPARHSHASAIVGDYLLVVGGSDGNDPLGDAYALNLVTRVWKRLETGISRREMCAMHLHPACAGSAILFGGRGEEGAMLGDCYRISVAETCAIEKISEDAAANRRCCHTVVPRLCPSPSPQEGVGVVCVGGFTPAGMPVDDLVVPLEGKSASPFPARRALVRRQQDELHFGLGHSSSTSLDNTAVYCISGIVPGSVSGTLSVYRLCANTDAAEEGAVGASSNLGAAGNGAQTIQGVL